MRRKNIIYIGLIIIIGVIGFLGFQWKERVNNTVNVAKEEEKKEIIKEKEEPKEEVKLKDNSIGVPVLYYHSIYDNPKKDELIVSKEMFREQMKYLKDNNYKTLTLTQLQEYIRDNKEVPEKSVAITFDDGWGDNYENAYPVLREYGFNATIFVITSMVDNHHLYLKSKEIKEMSENGIEIGSHTVNHDNLIEISKEKRKKTLEDSKKSLEDIIKKQVTSIAYPFGTYNNDVLKDSKALGYTLGFTTDKGWGNGKNDLFKIKRVYVNGNANMDVFKERLNNPNYK
ncbi:polysaccharide deacetylase family protein [Clostridium hydrogeniformans]|uniref:polysaccharide deacetylase family protein n=1 Tax=Clostridium hydrogeniformans TaxID=349933 RepID=UPI00048718ED|nr:polysaccharide deacetylase family protein [Clostridium hydrogeniformans]